MKVLAVLFVICLTLPAVAQEIRVIDGDTFELDGEIIRLWGIDAPESDQACSAFGEPVGAGDLAAEVLQDLVQTLDRCETVDTDRDGQILARCFLDSGEDVGALMVEAGFAWDWPPYSGGAYADEAARATESGLMTIDCMLPWEWREAMNIKTHKTSGADQLPN